VTTLADLPLGERGRVARILGTDHVSVRLMEMGLTPGAEFQLIGSTLLGDPIELEVRGYRLSVRRSEAARIEVQPQG
jgi:ferrous iron transport protein A